jgi:hypothetical protein
MVTIPFPALRPTVIVLSAHHLLFILLTQRAQSSVENLHLSFSSKPFQLSVSCLGPDNCQLLQDLCPPEQRTKHSKWQTAVLESPFFFALFGIFTSTVIHAEIAIVLRPFIIQQLF